jgi:hypothetical protein
MVNRTTRESCRTNKDIQDIIKLCKINKITFINSKDQNPAIYYG